MCGRILFLRRHRGYGCASEQEIQQKGGLKRPNEVLHLSRRKTTKNRQRNDQKPLPVLKRWLLAGDPPKKPRVRHLRQKNQTERQPASSTGPDLIDKNWYPSHKGPVFVVERQEARRRETEARVLVLYQDLPGIGEQNRAVPARKNDYAKHGNGQRDAQQCVIQCHRPLSGHRKTRRSCKRRTNGFALQSLSVGGGSHDALY